MGMGEIRVGLCDDSAEIRRGLMTYLEGSEGMSVCGSYGSGPEAIAGVSRDEIDVLLLDVRMPGMTGPAVAAELAAAASPCKVIYLTSYPEDVPARGALRATVRAALTKDVTPENLVRTIQLVIGGMSLLGREYERLGRSRDMPPSDEWAGGPRQREVLRMVREGLTNRDIAGELGMSASWVKLTISKLCRRAGVATRTALATYSEDGGQGAIDGE